MTGKEAFMRLLIAVWATILASSYWACGVWPEVASQGLAAVPIVGTMASIGMVIATMMSINERND